MSTTTFPVAPSTTPQRAVTTVPAEQRIAIRGVSWDLYDRISEAIGEKQRVFLAFDGKDLEIMTKGPNHEDYRDLIGDFLKAVTTACGIRSRWLGETTWRRPKADRGLEADQCCIFDPEKLAAANKARANLSNEIADYPDPDLAVEIDISPSLVDRPAIYAALKVSEVWRFDGDQVVFEQLGRDGKYTAVKRSRWLPVRPEYVRRRLVEEDSSDDVQWRCRLTEWAKDLAPGGNGT
ncbi:MAG: Uma2 family endonuclease [Isosphaerales bacterium]